MKVRTKWIVVAVIATTILVVLPIIAQPYGVESHIPLRDVPQDHSLRMDIEFVHEKGWFQGYPDGTFKPDRNISPDQMANVLTRSFPDGMTRAEFATMLRDGYERTSYDWFFQQASLINKVFIVGEADLDNPYYERLRGIIFSSGYLPFHRIVKRDYYVRDPRWASTWNGLSYEASVEGDDHISPYLWYIAPGRYLIKGGMSCNWIVLSSIENIPDRIFTRSGDGGGPYYEWDPTWERYFFSIEKAIIDFDFLISLDTVIEEGIGIDGDEIVIEPTDKAFIISCLDVGGSELEGYHYGDYWGNVAAPQVGGDMSYLGWDYETSRPDAYIWGKEQYERWFQRG